MAFLTSYLFRGVELNDSTNYTVPWADTAFDDKNPSEASYAYREENTPVLTGVTVQQAVVTLPINIMNAANSEELFEKLGALKAVFNPRDKTKYQLQRRLPHEQYYNYIECTVRDFTFDTTRRRVTITLEAEDKTWKSATWLEESIVAFDTGSTTETLTVEYEGYSEVNPVIEIEALSASVASPIPLYYRDVTAFYYSPEQIKGPIRLVTGWNTTTLVGASPSKMRADGLDISVTYNDVEVERYVAGTQANRRVWANHKGTGLPNFPRAYVLPSRKNEIGDADNNVALLDDDTQMYVVAQDGRPLRFSDAGSVMIEDEIITYTGVTVLPKQTVDPVEGMRVLLTGLTRGVDGTSAADHAIYSRLKRGFTYKVNYGYTAGFEPDDLTNDLKDWPLLDYTNSDNKDWKQAEGIDAGATLGTADQYGGWFGTRQPSRARTGETSWVAPASNDTTVPSKAVLRGYYYYSGTSGVPSGKERLSNSIPCLPGREPQFIKLLLTLKGVGSYPTIVARVYLVEDQFGQAYETKRLLWEQSHSSTSPTQYDTGWIDTDFYRDGFSHLVVEVKDLPPNNSATATDFVTVDEFWMRMDTWYPCWPGVGTLGTEKGAIELDEEFGLDLTIYNDDDPDDNQEFYLRCRARVGDVITIDCGELTVEGDNGATIRNVNYKLPTWLRLLPGTNQVKVSGVAGTGQIDFKLLWKNRY